MSWCTRRGAAKHRVRFPEQHPGRIEDVSADVRQDELLQSFQERLVVKYGKAVAST